MATRQTNFSMTRTELKFWREAFLAAEVTALLKSNGKKLSAAGVAHLAAEYATAAVIELRNANN